MDKYGEFVEKLKHCGIPVHLKGIPAKVATPSPTFRLSDAQVEERLKRLPKDIFDRLYKCVAWLCFTGCFQQHAPICVDCRRYSDHSGTCRQCEQ